MRMTSKSIWRIVIIAAVVASSCWVDVSDAEAKKKGKGKSKSKTSSSKSKNKFPPKDYDPNTKVYIDALFFRCHAEDCPALFMKENKKSMTLEEADKAGAMICGVGMKSSQQKCLQGYQRKHPQKQTGDDTLVWAGEGRTGKKLAWHVPGCHRGSGSRSRLKTRKAALAEGGIMCEHCAHKVSFAKPHAQDWPEKSQDKTPFVAPAGWSPKAYSPDQLPPKKELDIWVEETLGTGLALSGDRFEDPAASMEHFVTRRFFFPQQAWRNQHMCYRVTGDKRVLEKMRASARFYNKLAKAYPSAAAYKANGPEGSAFMWTMAVTARITMKMARKYPGKVSKQEFAEAEDFLKTIVATLKPTYEKYDNIDSEYGINQGVADAIRKKIFNRAANGWGMMAQAAAGLTDLQVIKRTNEYQKTIDCYNKTVAAYVKYFRDTGDFQTYNGKTHFFYPYSPNGGYKMQDGIKVYKRPEDVGHSTITLRGMQLIYEANSNLGVDDELLTAWANMACCNATTTVTFQGKQWRSGFMQPPVIAKERVMVKPGWHEYAPCRGTLYHLEAFRPGLIKTLATPLNASQAAKKDADYGNRTHTLFAHYLKAYRKDRSLIHLGEKSGGRLASRR
ncbi:hypothetical protein BVX97_01790 [bacterium E08(2017)]|nr:hypothetical protein BVX97_01790 [bacterium E08(2017)]